jgi:hypothetical protein
MARRKQRTATSASSGAPGLVSKTSAGAPALNPLSLQGGNRYLDPTAALQEIEHPSAQWAGVELQPIKPRR